MAGGGILGDKRPYFHHCVLQHGIRGNIDLPYTACAIVDHFDLMAEDDSGGPNIFERNFKGVTPDILFSYDSFVEESRVVR
ncbi:MAG: hypothetical protein [Olavius algarvensis Gamma 1 endosymbiont]|nr:MAG: hypothetical protein [Olavius algarvensis Gamma 1 endosymbiont]